MTELYSSWELSLFNIYQTNKQIRWIMDFPIEYNKKLKFIEQFNENIIIFAPKTFPELPHIIPIPLSFYDYNDDKWDEKELRKIEWQLYTNSVKYKRLPGVKIEQREYNEYLSCMDFWAFHLSDADAAMEFKLRYI